MLGIRVIQEVNVPKRLFLIVLYQRICFVEIQGLERRRQFRPIGPRGLGSVSLYDKLVRTELRFVCRWSEQKWASILY